MEDILHGESNNVEFKVSLPKDSEKYTKTIVAFANTQGGQLIVGVDDKTRDVVGVSDDDLFRMMDSISNAVSDSCEPQIVPNIEPQTISGKTVIVVSVTPGANRPYYIKSRGKENGTFIRVAGTSRPARSQKIKELEMEGARIYWDELTCIGYPVTEEAIQKLCNDILSYRRKMGLPDREIGITQLVNWKLLKMETGTLLPSNAFVLMTSDFFPFSKTQCAVFKGIDRTVFLDKKEFDGPLYEQIEEATNFVLRNIRLGATIDGLIRKEAYELPLEAIREMIINAHCHRNLNDDSCVQVAIYDDRLEVTSPGGLYNGLTYDELMNGHSKIRNRAIANIFNKMGLVESWGTGVRRIMGAAAEYGLPTPEFQIFDDMFRVNLYRRSEKESENIGETSEKHRRSIGEASEKHRKKEYSELNETQKKILELFSRNAQLSALKMSQEIGISSRNVESNIKSLKKDGFLIRHGSPKNGYWEIVK